MCIQFYPFKWTMLFIGVLVCMLCRPLHAQQIYASSQTNGTTGICLLCGVVNPNNAVNNSNLNDYSSFAITAGLLGVTVYQTLIFPSVSNSGCDSLVIGIGSGDALLSANLFGGVTIQTYNGNAANNDVRTLDSSVLRLLQNNTRAEAILHPTRPFDRIKVTLNSALLGLLNTFRIYYAYRNPGKPAAPSYTVPVNSACGDVWLPITNHSARTNYNVRVIYRDLFLDVRKDTSYTVIDNDSVLVRNILLFTSSPIDVYVQAVNPFTGCTSDSIHKVFTFGGNAEKPVVDKDSLTICLGNSATLHAVTPTSTFPSKRWYDAPVGGNLLHTGEYFTVSPSQTTTYYAAAGLICENPQRTHVTVFVTRLPDPSYTTPTVPLCTDATIPILNHQNGLNYRVYVQFRTDVDVRDTSFTVVNNNMIVVPNPQSYAFVNASIYVQAINPVTGCVSDTVPGNFSFGAFAVYPEVDADSVAICLGTSVTLHAFYSLSNLPQIRWYDSPSGGTLLHTGNFFSVSPATSTTYYVTSAFTCEYPRRRPVKVEVRPCPSGNLQTKESMTSRLDVNKLSMFPSPTSGLVYIRDGHVPDGAVLSIYDLQGRLVKRERLRGNSFNISGPSGMYIVRIEANGKLVTQEKIQLQQ